ncbi:MAG: sulfate adenylyltransferase subunit CysN [Spirochaetaceae bacterium]|nr:sulfate adenylyltransferase subunit CysN [Spirochaetaceae bacterium]
MKGLLKFITCGSVDDGKSTLIGHILYDSKLLFADQEKALELESKVGSRGGKIDYSLLLDGLMAEREQGITIDVAYRYFSTEKRSFIVADTPGHEEYTRNMAVGASFADLAIILVDASQGVLVQTRRHARICSLMGIEHFIFAVNKMDLANYSENRFGEVSAEIGEIVRELSLQDVVIIPVSATEGDNVTAPSAAMPWYTGKTILSHLETVDVRSEREGDGFYMPVQRVCRPNREFRGFMGHIESGVLGVGDEITALPSGEKARVKRIVRGFSDTERAARGQAVNVVLDREVDVSRGCVLLRGVQLPVSSRVQATVLWMDDARLEVGRNFFAKLGTKQIPAAVTRIHYAVDVNTGAHTASESLGKNEIASVDLSFSEPIVADEFKKNRCLGELILIDRVSNMTSACGVVTAVLQSASRADGDVGREQRAALKLQTPMVAEFVLGQNGVNEAFVAAVEKRLAAQGRHTYRFAPSAREDYAALAEHLYNAGLVVLLALDSRLASCARDKRCDSPWWFSGWQQNLVQASVDDAVSAILSRSAFVQSDSDYAI